MYTIAAAGGAPFLGCRAYCVAGHLRERSGEEKDDELDSETGEERCSSFEAVDDRDASESSEKSECLQKTRHPSNFVWRGTRGFEERSRICCHCHDSSVHHHEQRSPSKNRTASKLQAARVATSQPDVEKVVALVVGKFDGGNEFVHLVLERWIIEGEVTAEFGRDLTGLLFFAVADEPARRLGNEPNGGDDDDGWEAHAGERKSPDPIRVPAFNAVENPVDEHDTQVVGREHNRESEATVVRLCELGDPRVCDGVDEADSDAKKDTAADEHVGVVAMKSNLTLSLLSVFREKTRAA